ncbi:MAG: hypothetical protein ACE5IR_00650 [bacterium]
MNKDYVKQFEAVQLFIDFIAAHPSDKEILDFTFPKRIQDRIQELVIKNNAGAINQEELNELKEYERLDSYGGLLKTKIMQKKSRVSA